MLTQRSLTPEDYIAILKRRWIWLAIPMVLAPLIAIGITFKVTPVFTSQTLVLIERPKVPDTYVKPVVAEDLDSRLASMKEQILSRSRLEPIIKQYNLGDPKNDMDTRVENVRKDIDIKPIHSEVSGADGLPGFFISFKAGDASTAQQVCRQITSLFLTENVRAREQSAEGTTEFLNEQLTEAKNDLNAQDAKLAAFQRQNLGALPDDQSGNANMLTTLNGQLNAATQSLTDLEQQRSYREALLAQQGQSISPVPGAGPANNGRAAAVPTPEQAKELAQLEAQEADLTARYTPDYPDVIAVKRNIADLKKEIAQNSAIPGNGGSSASSIRMESPATLQLRAQVSAIDDAIQGRRRDQAAVQHQIALYEGRVASSPLVGAQYKELNRDYSTAQTFYDSLLTKMQNSQMATSLEREQQGEQFRIMDDANLPEQPTFPDRTKFALGGLVAGLAIGIGLIALLEYRDKSIRTERDVWAFTKLPTLGIIALSQGSVPQNRTGLFKRRLKSGNPPLAKMEG